MAAPKVFMSQTMALVWRALLMFFLVTATAISLLALPARCQATAAEDVSSIDQVIAENSSGTVPDNSPGNPLDNSRNDSQNTSPDNSGNTPARNTSAPNNGAEAQQTPDKNEKKNDRMFFIMPNYLTVENQSQVGPISWKEKFAITAKGAFDPYEFAIVGILSGIRQAENAYPGFGQGMEGYGKRYGTAFADQVDANIMVGGVFPSILRTDPRYFAMGKGRPLTRFVYAFTRVLVTRTDSGRHVFNVPEFAGNATAIAISNLYYPAADRGFSASANNWGVQMALDAFGNELKEFWPDIHSRLPKRRSSHRVSSNSAICDTRRIRRLPSAAFSLTARKGSTKPARD
jgi:hypothetical protein